MSTSSLYKVEAENSIVKAKHFEVAGDYDSAASEYEKAAYFYDKAADSASFESTKKNYIDFAQRFIEKAAQLQKRHHSRENTKHLSIEDTAQKEFLDRAYSLIVRSNITWDDISGLHDLKGSFRLAWVMAIGKPDQNVELEPTKGILLYGPPGTGKTLFASAVSNMIKATFFNVQISQVLSKYVGEAPKTVRAIFTLAKNMAPSVLFFDEIDALARSRDENRVGTGLLEELLTCIDGIKEESEGEDAPLIIVVGSTNKPWMLDEAILSRFEESVYFPPPDFEARKGIFEIHLRKRGFDVDADLMRFIEMTEGYAGREIAFACKRAIRMMIVRSNPNIKELAEMDYEKASDITIKITPILALELERAIDDTRKNITKNMIDRFVKWGEEHGKM